MTPERASRLRALDGAEIDVLIVGAGVNGAGTFRDLCAQGLTCLLVDRADFGSGTSAAPSRLIHGGLKYLETGEFRLVAQSTLERNLLLKNAPHCVEPLPTMIPIFSWTRGLGAALRTLLGSAGVPRSRGAALVKVGLALYDFYGRRHRVMPRHALVGRARALASMPGLTDRIVAAGTYHDARITRAERLVFELVQDGLGDSPAAAACNWTRIAGTGSGRVTLRGPSGEIAVRPRLVVNAAGPWIDTVNAQFGHPTRMIGGTKGSHIVLDHPELVRRLNGRMIYFEADDGRICLVYDFLGRALVGSTDIPAGDPDAARCEDDEIDYFMASLRSLLPGLDFDRSRIVHAYSGVRPLPATDAAIPGLISRDHSAPVLEPEAGRPFPVICLVGGKWTTYRGFSEEAADLVLARLGRPRRISTERLPIGGGRGFPATQAERARWVREHAAATGLEVGRLEILLARYGSTAAAIARHEAAFGAAPLPGAEGYRLAEIDWIARHEAVEHLCDIVLRRTTLAVRGDLTGPGLSAIARTAGAALRWDAARCARELRIARAELRERYRMPLAQ